MTICVWDHKWFHWKCDFEKSVCKVSNSYSLGFDRLQKRQVFWGGKSLKISQKIHGGDRGHTKVRKKNPENLKINKWVIFHLMLTSVTHISKKAYVICSHVLLECITYLLRESMIYGIILRAPSNLTTSPFISGFSTRLCTRWAYSSGVPRRWGKGTVRAKKFLTFSGKDASSGVSNRPGKRKGRSEVGNKLIF